MFGISHTLAKINKLKDLIEDIQSKLETISSDIENFDLDVEKDELDEEAGWCSEEIQCLEQGKNENGLMPCPFCGEITEVKIETQEAFKEDLFIKAVYFGYCTCCEAAGPIAQHRKDNSDTAHEVIEKAKSNWNKRIKWKTGPTF